MVAPVPDISERRIGLIIDPPSPQHMSDATLESPPETAEQSLEREIGHDEYDPIGTVTLILIYTAIITALWFFMYFVEFVGNDPTVTGLITAL